MDYKVLYRKYRPDDFENIIGQEYTIKVLKNAILKEKISHAYLFTGPRGTGKTSTAKVFAKAINCLNPKNGNPCGQCSNCLNNIDNPDIVEIDAASNNGVDEIREIINNVKIAPSFSKYKVYIIDEVHMLSTSAFNALLLTLEEPPGHVVFILATTDVQNVPITILSRCQRFDFKPIDRDKMTARLKYIREQEKLNVTDEALNEIAYISNGGLRDALSILDQLSSKDDEITIEDVYSNFGTVSSAKIEEIIDKFTTDDIENVTKLVHEFKENGINYTIVIEKLIEKLRYLALDIKTKKNNKLDFDNIYNLIFELNKILNNTNINIDAYILIELALIKYMGNNEISKYDFNKNISREIKKENITREIILENEVDNNIEDISSQEEKSEISDEMVKIRINNCFVNASKEFKSVFENTWQEYKDYIAENFTNLVSLIMDTNVAMVSDKYAVLKNDNLSTSKLINSKIKTFEIIYNELLGLEYKFVCLTNEEWENEVNLFKNNRKNGIIYKYIEEQEEELSPKDDLDKIASEIFDNEILEYE